MIVRFGPWNKEKVVSLNIIISFIWLLSVTIIFPFYQVVWETLSKDKTLIVVPQNSNLIEIFDATPQLYVGCFFTPRFNRHISISNYINCHISISNYINRHISISNYTTNPLSALKPSSSTTW